MLPGETEIHGAILSGTIDLNRLDSLATKISAVKRVDPNFFSECKSSILATVALAVQGLLNDRRASLIADVAYVFKGHGISELLDGIAELVPSIIDQITKGAKIGVREVNPVVEFASASSENINILNALRECLYLKAQMNDEEAFALIRYLQKQPEFSGGNFHIPTL
jgi:hypothetical protein